MAPNHITQQSTIEGGRCLVWGVMIKAINLIQEARFSYLRVSEKCVIFDLLPFCWSTYQYSYQLTICMSLSDVYEWRIMPLLEGNGIGLAHPRSTLIFFGMSRCTHSGARARLGFWGWCLTPTGIQCMEIHNTTINQHRRVVSISGWWEWCLFLTSNTEFHHILVGEPGRHLTLDGTLTKDTTINSNGQCYIRQRKSKWRDLSILCGLQENIDSTINHRSEKWDTPRDGR